MSNLTVEHIQRGKEWLSRARPPRTPPRLLTLPNRDEVMKAFHRSCPVPVGLLDIELERVASIHGDRLMLTAFVTKPRWLNHQHQLSSADPKALIGAAEILGQTAALHMRRAGASNGRG